MLIAGARSRLYRPHCTSWQHDLAARLPSAQVVDLLCRVGAITTMNVRRFLACALTMLCAATASAQGRGGGPGRLAPPAPRWPDGTINLGAVPGSSGLWDGAEPLATIPKNYERVAGRPRPGLVDLKDRPSSRGHRRSLTRVTRGFWLTSRTHVASRPPPHVRSALRMASSC